jgi:hypothetical protein
MTETKSLESVLKEYFAPSETKKAKGEAKFIITVNGVTMTNRIKTQKELDKTLRSIALEDARKGTDTKVLVYKLEGEASVDFASEVNVATPEED